VRRAVLFVLPLCLACSGDDSSGDASTDATLDSPEEPDVADVAVDVPPEPAIWVASATTLYKLDPETRVLARVADFDCSGEEMLDLAMNAKEELFGITTESVVRIDKTTGACTAIARGSQDLPYATAFVPNDAGAERWLGYQLATYDAIDPDSGTLTFVGAGLDDGGNAYSASGDMVSLGGGKTYFTALDYDPNAGDTLVQIDPSTGAVVRIVGSTGVAPLLGLAQWAGTLYAFSDRGRIFTVGIGDAGVTLKILPVKYDFGDAGAPDAEVDADADTDASGSSFISFRGAAVTSRAPTQ
jgi:hypothetical protein